MCLASKSKGSLGEFMRYVTLNVLGMIGLSCYILADTYFVSKGMGARGLSALNLAIPIYSFIHGAGLMLGVGGGTKYSILKSRGEDSAANQAFAFGVTAGGVIGIICFVAGIFMPDTITRLLGADAAVFEMCRTYLQVIMLFAPMFIMNNVLLCFVRNDGAPQLSMIAMLCGSLSNVVLDYIFIFPMGMGIFGAAAATGVAPVISMLILSMHFIRRSNGFRLCLCPIFSGGNRDIIGAGIPSLVTEVSSGVVIIVFNLVLMGIGGNVNVAAYGIIANLSLVVLSIYTGIAQGIQPLLSRYWGKGEYGKVKQIVGYAFLAVGVVSAIVYGAVWLGGDIIVTVFNEEGNRVLQQIALKGLRLYFIGGVFAGVNIVTSAYFTSIQMPRPAHIISLLRGFIVIIPAAFLLSDFLGITGVWCAFPVTEAAVMTVGVLLLSVYRNLASGANACRND